MSADLPAVPSRTVAGLGTTIGAVVVAVVGAVVGWLRLDPTSRGTVWAEDAATFLQERLDSGPIVTLWHPYGGYEQLVPRLLTDVAVLVRPIEDYAVVMTALSCAVVGLVGAAVFVLARDVVTPWPLRILVALVPAIVPTAPIEIAGNTANLHWYLLFLAPWVFRASPRTSWGSGVLAVVAGLVTGSEIQSALFLPLFVVAFLRAEGAAGRRRVIPVAVVAVLGIVAEVVALVTHPRPALNTAPAPTVADTVLGYLAQPFGGSWTWDVHRVAASVVAHGWAILAVPAVLLLAVLVLAVVVGLRGGRQAPLMVGVLAVASVVVWGASLHLNPQVTMAFAELTPDQLVQGMSLRYAAAASMFLLAAVVVAAATLIGTRPVSRPLRVLAALAGWVLVAGVVAAAVLNAGGVVTRRSVGPVWADGVRAAQTVCRTDPSALVFVKGAPTPPQWGATVPCRVLLGARP